MQLSVPVFTSMEYSACWPRSSTAASRWCPSGIAPRRLTERSQEAVSARAAPVRALRNITWKRGETVTADDPWGFANSLEWATSCPPPRHNFTSIPRIRSERPAFDLHYPHIRSGRDRHLEEEQQRTIGAGS